MTKGERKREPFYGHYASQPFKRRVAPVPVGYRRVASNVQRIVEAEAARRGSRRLLRSNDEVLRDAFKRKTAVNRIGSFYKKRKEVKAANRIGGFFRRYKARKGINAFRAYAKDVSRRINDAKQGFAAWNRHEKATQIQGVMRKYLFRKRLKEYERKKAGLSRVGERAADSKRMRLDKKRKADDMGTYLHERYRAQQHVRKKRAVVKRQEGAVPGPSSGMAQPPLTRSGDSTPYHTPLGSRRVTPVGTPYFTPEGSRVATPRATPVRVPGGGADAGGSPALHTPAAHIGVRAAGTPFDEAAVPPVPPRPVPNATPQSVRRARATPGRHGFRFRTKGAHAYSYENNTRYRRLFDRFPAKTPVSEVFGRHLYGGLRQFASSYRNYAHAQNRWQAWHRLHGNKAS